MGASAVRKTIGGRDFEFSRMAAADAVRVYYPLVKVLPPVMKALGPMIQKAVAAQTAGGDSAAAPGLADQAKALAAISALNEDAQIEAFIDGITNRLTADQLIEMMTLTFKSVACGGIQVDMNMSFGGGLSKTMLLVFWEALRVNFSDFFGASSSPSSLGAPQ